MKHIIIYILGIVMPLVAAMTGVVAQTQPDAEYNLIRRSYTLNADGSMDIRYRKELKLLRNRAITAYADKGETFIEYNPAFEELTINECYTIRPDGSKVVTPPNAFVKQLPSGCADCGRYNGIREMAIVHTALEYNCIIVLDYTLHRKSGLLTERFNLQTDCPVKRYELDYPGMPDSMRLHTNLPQTINEPYMKRRVRYDVEFQIGNLPQYTAENALPEARNLLQSLKRETDLQTVTAIHDWVVDYVTLNKIDLARVDYRMTPAAEVFRSNCGTALDKLGLLAALLNEAGFDARILNEGQNVPSKIVVNVKGTDYLVNASDKRQITYANEVKELLPLSERGDGYPQPQNYKSETKIGPVTFDTLPDGYLHYSIPIRPIDFHFKSVNLPPTRISNVWICPPSSNGNAALHYITNYTIDIPRKLRLVGGDRKIQYEIPGVGKIKVVIRKKGGKLLADKELVVIPSEITPEQYSDFRRLIIDWESSNELMFKSL
jgi:hypothetical protein